MLGQHLRKRKPMREIIVVCRSGKASRDRTARILDRYFWRIGDRTWRGKATNACLDRVSKELRKRATRNTAVVVHEIRSSSESRTPIIRIGSRHSFSEEGVVPVSSHPADFRKISMSHRDYDAVAAVVAIAALFHDLGKAANLFQSKLRRALNGGMAEADAIRHELISAAVWDDLFGSFDNHDLGQGLTDLTAEMIDKSCTDIRDKLAKLHAHPESVLPFKFVDRPESITHAIGMLILTHHRLPEGEADHQTILAARHVRHESPLQRSQDLAIATGVPFWHEVWWLRDLKTEARRLRPIFLSSVDIALRASLMLSDHLGSSQKTQSSVIQEHLANTMYVKGKPGAHPADSLSRHVKRVHRYTRSAFQSLHQLRDRYPAIDEAQVPLDIAVPEISPVARFAWQGEAAKAARRMCSEHEGGFFAAILAGTGTGKTRGAPTILAGAALGDKIPERRYFRINLGLGLRVLATQSAKEYVDDLGFSQKDVSVLVGDPPLSFREGSDSTSFEEQGSESLINFPEWLRVENPHTRVPEYQSNGETQWLKGLSLNTDRGLPAFIERFIDASGKTKSSGKRLLQAPIMVGTIDHLMGVASPIKSSFLLQSIRLMTSDLILDEIDQYDGEDLAAIARLVFQAAAAGRRVVIMSATLTPDISEAFYAAYLKGWSDHARFSGAVDHVNTLICGDVPGSVFTNEAGLDMTCLLSACRTKIIAGIDTSPTLRRAQILPPCDEWHTLVRQVDEGCSRLHDLNAVEIEGYRVSVGMVRMTRIAHTTALAVQMRSGNIGDRLRVIVCLHAQMPRLHRSYIETRLKRALTRKDTIEQHQGIRSLCFSESVFSRADDQETREIEIIVVTTPVIETGNDLDFDWAILDPISTRSIIQSAGRVCRHRPATGNHLNVYILGRSPIAIQQGELAMPGVETKQATVTKVDRESLKAFEKRHFADLAGKVSFATITAKPLLSDDVPFPLRDAEARLRSKMISVDRRDPLGLYLHYPNARWNLAMTQSRKFRRSDTGEIEFHMRGDNINDAVWYLDLAPGSKHSQPREAAHDLHLGGLQSTEKLFKNLTLGGWRELAKGGENMSDLDMRTLLRVSLSSYGDDIGQQFTYHEFTGFTRGTPEDLFEAFGKSK